jgi:dTDP-4-amino-4,6-dideoxygalactose transaminase
MINVTKTFLPPIEEYNELVKRAWDKAWITNNGELVQELEQKLKSYLGVKNLLFTGNGTIVLQMAIKALNITKEVITTPFSYVATTTAILWEGCTPVFTDINRDDFCIDPDRIEEKITENTEAILATHVFGLPCNVDKIKNLAEKYKLKIIYDGAHAFGSYSGGKPLLAYGDISTCSFHATKLFHTVEGGCIICNDDDLANKLMLYRQFGHIGDDYYSMGINGKNSEFHAAMGLCNLKYIDSILYRRKEQWNYYREELKNSQLTLVSIRNEGEFNYSYFPIVFSKETELLETMNRLKNAGINCRRYFYPSLNTLPYLKHQSCDISEYVAQRILCIPLFHDLTRVDQDRIVSLILDKG